MQRILLPSLAVLILLAIRSDGQTPSASPASPTAPPDQQATTISINPFSRKGSGQQLNGISVQAPNQLVPSPSPTLQPEPIGTTPDRDPTSQQIRPPQPLSSPAASPPFLNTSVSANAATINNPIPSNENNTPHTSPTPTTAVSQSNNSTLITDNQKAQTGPSPSEQNNSEEAPTNDQAANANPADKDSGIKILPDSIDIEEGSPLSRVLRLLALQGGINYIEPDINPKETIAFAVHGMTPKQAFYTIAQYKGFRIVENEGVVELFRDDIKSYETLSTKRYLIRNVNPMLIAQSIANFLNIDVTQSKGIIPTYPNPIIQSATSGSSGSMGTTSSSSGSSISGSSSSLGGGESGTTMNTSQGRFTPAFPFDQPVSRGKSKTGGAPGSSQTEGPSLYIDHYGRGGNAIVIRATQRQHEELGNYIPTIDVKEPQILVKVQVFEIDDTNGNGLGSTLSLSYGKNPDGSPAFTFNTLSGGVPGGSGISTGHIVNNPSGSGISLFGNQGLGLLGGFGYATGATALKDFQVTGQIQALAQRGRIHTLTQAQVIARNGVPAFISSTEQQYIETVNFSSYGNNGSSPSGSGSNGSVTQNSNLGASGTQSFTTGITIEAIPTLLGDGRIELNIEPIVSNQVGSTTGADGQTLPIIDSRNAPSDIIVHEGETIPIGGILALNRTDLKQKTPLLGDIPLINFFFRQQTANLARKNLLILVTPYIMKDTQTVQGVYTADDARAFKELKQDNSKLVVKKYNRKTTGQFRVNKEPSDIDYQQDNEKDTQKHRSWPFPQQ